MKQTNNWKIATILLAIVLLIVLVPTVNDQKQDYNGVSLSENELNSISNIAKERNLSEVMVTNLETGANIKFQIK